MTTVPPPLGAPQRRSYTTTLGRAWSREKCANAGSGSGSRWRGEASPSAGKDRRQVLQSAEKSRLSDDAGRSPWIGMSGSNMVARFCYHSCYQVVSGSTSVTAGQSPPGIDDMTPPSTSVRISQRRSLRRLGARLETEIDVAFPQIDRFHQCISASSILNACFAMARSLTFRVPG